jgi:hypothetical protein
MGFASLEVWATQPSFMWQQALDTFLRYYSPCNTVDESTHQFSTSQLYAMLEQHCGGNMTIEQMTEYLAQKEFKFEYTAEMQFEWLFKEVKQ